MSSTTRPPLRLSGARDLRSRLVLATLARRPVEIRRIRADAEKPGLRGDEASFLRLLDKLTSGSRINIDETGTTLRFSPGTLCGGSVEHDCGPSTRPVGWFMSAILPLAPFGARPLLLTLKGVTCGNSKARSADALAKCAAPILENFGCRGCVIDIERREASSREKRDWSKLAGSVVLRCPCVRMLDPVDLAAPAPTQRVRGVAYATRCAPALANRCAAAAREFLTPLQVDVRVATDASAQRDCAPVAGVGIVLVVENDQLNRGAECDAHSMEGDASPEALGASCARALVAEVKAGGCCDAATQPLVLALMACGADDASSAVLGPLSSNAISTLRLLKKFLGVTFKLGQDGGVVRATCLGAGLRNASKGVS